MPKTLAVVHTSMVFANVETSMKDDAASSIVDAIKVWHAFR